MNDRLSPSIGVPKGTHLYGENYDDEESITAAVVAFALTALNVPTGPYRPHSYLTKYPVLSVTVVETTWP